jgi:DNA primase
LDLRILKEKVKEAVDPVRLLEHIGATNVNIENDVVRCACPIHKGRKQNFSFDIQKGIFSCFSRHCGEEVGLPRDVFLLVMLVKNMNFPQSVEYLAKFSGIDSNVEYTKQDDDEYKIKQWLRTQKKLDGDDIPSLDESILNMFSREYPPYLLNRYSDTSILNLFEVSYATSGHFANRIIVPIRDEDGRLVGLSGRLATDNKFELRRKHKYLHTANFSSGAVLYGLNHAKTFIERDGIMVLSEGFFDVMSSFQKGICNICATMGATILPEQINLVIKHTSTVYLAYDGDIAGRKGAWKIYKRLKDYCDVLFLDIPKGEDVDSLDVETYWDLYLSPMKAYEFEKKYHKEIISKN